MKKSEKTERTKDKILSAAVREFGLKGYDAGTINHICNESGISKGLIYHNYQSKDEIYLCCVECVLQHFTDYIKQNINWEANEYMQLRFRFFSENPLFARIFFEAVLQPPKHLAEQIKKRKQELNQLNLNIYRSSLKGITLRAGVTEQEAVEYYSMMQEMFNGYFSSLAYSGTDFMAVMADHESKLAKILDFMLYGIAKEENTK